MLSVPQYPGWTSSPLPFGRAGLVVCLVREHMRRKRLAWDLGLCFIALMSFAGGLLKATDIELQLGQLHKHFTKLTQIFFSFFLHH